MLLPVVAAIALQAAPADTAPEPPIHADTPTHADTPSVSLDSATLATAYLDPGARDLLERARARRRALDHSIAAYETLVRERVSVALRALWRERLVYRRETATRVHWSREGPVRLEVLGAREVAPVAGVGLRVPDDLDDDSGGDVLADLAFDPATDAPLIRWSGDSFVRNPLAADGERYHRYRSGDTLAVRLPDGRPVRTVELEVLPRRESPNLIRGSFWLDADSQVLVRASFRLSRDVEFGITVSDARPDTARRRSIVFGPTNAGPDTAAADADSPPLALRLALAMVPEIRASVRYVTVDYGFWERRWWLPRLIAFEGVVQIGGAEVPLRYERRYDGYRVTADSTPDAAPSAVATAADSAEDEPEIIVSMPDDTTALLTSEYLSPDAFADEPWLLGAAERDAMLGELAELSGFGAEAGAPWRFEWSSIDWDVLARYNRVEELSVGAAMELDPGPITVSAAARLGTGDAEPRGMLSLRRRGADARYELTGYRRLAAMDPRAKAFSSVSSASALLFGYDEPDYYDVVGASLTGRPLPSDRQWYEWRLYAQREARVRKETDLSVPHLFDRDRRFRANPAAAEALQYGAGLTLRTWRGMNPQGFRWGGELRLDAATGDFTYVRPSLVLRSAFPLPGSFAGALEAEAGLVRGESALQHLRRVGGTASVRGYHGSALVGESSWRLRAELATHAPAARLILFADAGWAGPRDEFGGGDPIASAGIGAGFLDGFVRVDIARALVAPTGWRVAAYVDGPL